jgi:hypothetical protein
VSEYSTNLKVIIYNDYYLYMDVPQVGEEDEDAQAFATETGASVACAAAGRRGSVAFNTRRFTWVMRDDVLYVTETGKGTSMIFK